MLGESNFFFNYALSNATGPFKSLAACGYFYCSPGSKTVDTFEGVINYTDGRKPFKLKSRKIPDQVIQDMKNRGKNWLIEFLKENDPNAKNNSNSQTLSDALEINADNDKDVLADVLKQEKG